MIAKLDLILSELDLLKIEWQLQNAVNSPAIQQALAIQYTFDSLHLEGSRLTLRETELLLRNGLMSSEKSLAENMAALNHFQAIDFIREKAADQVLLSENLLLELHALSCRAMLEQYPGQYRQIASLTPDDQPAPSPDKLPEQVQEHMAWLRREGAFMHPVVFAAETHRRLLYLQPFKSANAVCARLLMNLILLENDFPLVTIASDDANRTAYQTAMAQIDLHHASDDWTLFIAEQIRLACQSLISAQPSHASWL
ncbi:MAG: Fic family protein [Methylomonas sp.]|nr:Fic family protein [Methylomonas sp.]PPD22124.1 MAG: hypothetical protein CTY23_03460 [Methylomonas sp.]PPD24993.1 MAG: hypothetical protein CTY22_10025 [Methylomonas sp.]PPD34321.1 MAG: hypothetical protein CTY21_10005 [Methylomonas sp.]PPD42389.1 MAG: hypothetical protein CTY17_01210 [Methylomonas sp.]